MYSKCLIALGTEQAELLSQLLPSYDVVCLFILMQGYPLLNISVVPYEDHGLAHCSKVVEAALFKGMLP